MFHRASTAMEHGKWGLRIESMYLFPMKHGDVIPAIAMWSFTISGIFDFQRWPSIYTPVI